jgi:hypothetical protein
MLRNRKRERERDGKMMWGILRKRERVEECVCV